MCQRLFGLFCAFMFLFVVKKALSSLGFRASLVASCFLFPGSNKLRLFVFRFFSGLEPNAFPHNLHKPRSKKELDMARYYVGN